MAVSLLFEKNASLLGGRQGVKCDSIYENVVPDLEHLVEMTSRLSSERAMDATAVLQQCIKNINAVVTNADNQLDASEGSSLSMR